MNTINQHVRFQGDSSVQWYNPLQLSAETLSSLGKRPSTIKSLIDNLEQLQADDYLTYILGYYQTGLSRYGDVWGYNDLLTILHAATTLLKPESYLEIGVRRGRSLAVAATVCPTINIYGFDLWMENYAGMENPGPDFVAKELKNMGHTGQLTLVSGDSQKTIPEFMKNNPDLYFDLITVDGDHSEEGARIDLKNVLPRLKEGGVILLDDITHPQHQYLNDVWDEVIGQDDRFISMKYTALGYGIAFAIRRSF